MKTSLAVMGLVLCSLPLPAQNAGRRVVAACELTTATVIPSGKENAQGRELAIRVTNNSPRTVAMPRSPDFGWRVESLHKWDWRFKAEGGPVRRISTKDAHIVASGKAASSQPEKLLEITPGSGETFFISLPDAENALQPDSQYSHYKLTLYWAADAGLAKSFPMVLPCGLAAQWIVDVQKLPPPK